ncbi:transaldolase [Alicyclobacillus sp. SP_1]|uniref:transaldolase n=1 Tax=Alicyclobacillus sp. SP_1 TaxID=2942475 RepID=UPI002157FCB7|nr:transaldolase [Alicyclobacillus sp. SP_1]
MNALEQLHTLGQSIWYDNVERGLLESGEMARLIANGVRGVTSNPTIFEKAILGSSSYDQAIAEAVSQRMTVDELYDHLVFHDIRAVADLLAPVYQSSRGIDGYVSIEVSPALAEDADGTVREAHRLRQAVGRDNVMIKVPATHAGIEAVERLIAEGVPVNVTLIFGLTQYGRVLEAYIAGLESRQKQGLSLDVASVASFFVSRVDTLVDKEVSNKKLPTELAGKAAVANAKLAYAHFKTVSESDRWQSLATSGARVQRPLWASTSTKNPAYPVLLYVQTLVGPHTVNTVPPATLTHIEQASEFERSVDVDVPSCRAAIAELESAGISMEQVSEQLLDEGLQGFRKSFDQLMGALTERLAGRPASN